MSMDFFRRPQLSGKNIRRLNYATVRGSLRRHDADLGHDSPYFANADGKSIDITTQDGTVSVGPFADSKLSTILSDLNAALGPVNAEAFEQDGVLYLRSTVPGADGSISVSAGAAAPYLGFDLSLGAIRGRAGDLESSPEGRIKNPFGAAFPGRNENFVMDSIRGAMGRISANTDVLYADLMRQDAVLRKLNTYVNNGSYISVAEKVYTGPVAGFLSKSSTASDLTPFFILVDQATHQPLANKVTAVVRNQTVVAQPQTDASLWADSGNVLGRNITKGTFAIDTIDGGRVVTTQAPFGAEVHAGDFAEIKDATNLTPFSNNGLRWVVDQVLSTTKVVLRPASPSELATLGVDFPSDTQPIIELNDACATDEVFGTITFSTGLFCEEVNLLISPPLPAGLNFDLWASVPLSLRAFRGQDRVRPTAPVSSAVAAENETTHNGFYTTPTVSMAGRVVQVSSCIVRRNGRLLTIPAKNFDTTGMPNSTRYVYWDEATNSLLLDLPANASDHVAVKVGISAGATTAVVCARKIADGSRVYTVGAGAQFPTLDVALDHIGAIDRGVPNPERVELVLMEGTTLTGQFKLPASGCTVRGASSDVVLTVQTEGSDTPLILMGGAYVFRDFVLKRTTGTGLFGSIAGDVASSLLLENVRMPAEESPVDFAVVHCGNVLMKNCSFRLTSGVSQGSNSFRAEGCVFSYEGLGAAQMFMSSDGVGSPWDGGAITLRDCEFTGWVTTDTNDMMVDSGVAALEVDHCTFTMAAFAAGALNRFASCTTATFRDTIVDGTPLGIIGDFGVILNCCTLKTKGGMGTTVHSAGVAEDCYFYNADAAVGAAGVGATILNVIVKASNNVFTGTATTAVSADSSTVGGVEIRGNSISLRPTARTTAFRAITATVNAASAKISENLVRVVTQAPAGVGNYFIYVGCDDASVIGNTLSSPFADVDGISMVNSGSGSYVGWSVVGNRYFNTANSGSHVGIVVNGNFTHRLNLSSNIVKSSSVDAYGLRVLDGIAPRLNVTSNILVASFALAVNNGIMLRDSQVTGNELYGMVGTTGNELLGVTFSGNRVSGVSHFGYSCTITGNFFGIVSIDQGDGGMIPTEFVGNYASQLTTSVPVGGSIVGTALLVHNCHIGILTLSDVESAEVTGNVIDGAVTSNNVSVAHLRFCKNTVVGAMAVSYGTDIEVCDNTFKSTVGIGYQTSNVLFTGNICMAAAPTLAGSKVTVGNCRSAGLSIGAMSTASPETSVLTISGSQFFGDVVIGSAGNYYPRSVRFTGNYVHGRTTVNSPERLLMTGNEFHNEVAAGGNSLTLVVSNNTIAFNPLLHSVIEGNTIRTSRTGPVVAGGHSETVKLSGLTGLSFSNNTVVVNADSQTINLDQAWSFYEYAVFIDGCIMISVKGNNIWVATADDQGQNISYVASPLTFGASTTLISFSGNFFYGHGGTPAPALIQASVSSGDAGWGLMTLPYGVSTQNPTVNVTGMATSDDNSNTGFPEWTNGAELLPSGNTDDKIATDIVEDHRHSVDATHYHEVLAHSHTVDAHSHTLEGGSASLSSVRLGAGGAAHFASAVNVSL
jgi:hypothetical protein